MGLFDSVIGQLLGGTAQPGGPQTNLLNGLMELLQNQPGGVNGVLQQLNSAGLGNLVQSWISTGHNLPISADQIHQVLGSEQVQQLAQRAGISPHEVSSHLSTLLPQLVDRLTPNGQLPAGGLMGALQGLMSK